MQDGTGNRTNSSHFQATALSDEEFAAFKCRSGQYYQYGVSDGGQGHAVDWNEYASASNNYAGCFPDMRLPCKRTDNVCKMETDWYAGRDGAMHQFTMNSIPGNMIIDLYLNSI